MDFNKYQFNTRKTFISTDRPYDLILSRMTLGLVGESGEVADKVTKYRSRNCFCFVFVSLDLAPNKTISVIQRHRNQQTCPKYMARRSKEGNLLLLVSLANHLRYEEKELFDFSNYICFVVAL